MRLVGVSLMLFGAAIAWYLGVKGEDPATLRAQLFAFFHLQDPGTVLPGGANPTSGPGGSLSSLLQGAQKLAGAAAPAPARAGGGGLKLQ